MSAYVYTGNNPIMLVDPDGKRIFVNGEQASEYMKQLQSTTKMKVICNDGQITFEGEARNKYDEALIEASKNDKYDLKINATAEDHKTFLGGFLEAEKNRETGRIEVNQVINTNVSATVDKLTKSKGRGVAHETIEAYLIGEYMVKNNVEETSSSSALLSNPIYEYADKKTNEFGKGQNFEVNQPSFPSSPWHPVTARGKVYEVNRFSGEYRELWNADQNW